MAQTRAKNAPKNAPGSEPERESGSESKDEPTEDQTTEDQTTEEESEQDTDQQDGSGADPGQQDTGGQAQHSGGRRRKKVLTAKGAIRRSIEQLEELTGRTPESVIAVERQEDGWKVTLELVESRRIPDTSDILAEYSARLDDRGELTGYQREARYVRGRVDS